MGAGFDRIEAFNPNSGTKAWSPYLCGWCGDSVVGARVATYSHQNKSDPMPSLDFLRCTGCGHGSVRNDGAVLPGTLPAREVQHLPETIESLYREARSAHSVSAFTAAEMAARTILVHVAVDKGREGRTTFAQAVDFLKDEKHITEAMKPWVDWIRQRGNKAAHEVELTTADQSLGTLNFVCALLENVYQHPGQLEAALGALEPAPEDRTEYQPAAKVRQLDRVG